MNKDDFLDAKATVSKIEDLLTKAEALFKTIAPGIVPAILDYHSASSTLLHGVRWALQAANDVCIDWHSVVSHLVVADEEGCSE
jgi:hypothetical protein